MTPNAFGSRFSRARSTPTRATRLLVVVALSAALLVTGIDPYRLPIPAAVAQGGSVAAQDACLADAEPNDTEVDATSVRGPFCVDGTLPEGDQDLALWDVGDEDARTRWRITLEGVPGPLTILQFFRVTSPPGQSPVTVKSVPVLDVNVVPGQAEPTIVDDQLLPVGQYLVGASRSGLPGGGEPAVFDYAFRVEPGASFPTLIETEPNDDAASATAVADAFEAGGDLAGSSYDVFAWTVTEPSARWDLELRVPLEETASLDLSGPDGARIGNQSGWHIRLYDLALDPGTYTVRLAPNADSPRPYILRAVPNETLGDPEPNDETIDAVPIVDGTPVSGRLAGMNDRDRYRLAVPVGDERLRDVRMLWRSDSDRTVCLLDEADERLMCRHGIGGLVLENLRLLPGQHTLEVSGVPDPADAYLMRVDVTSATAADFEAEPNDDVPLATALDPTLGMRGRGGDDDLDHYRLRTDGDPQLWQLELTGTDVRRLALVKPNGTDLATAKVGAGGASTSLTDLYLVPGEHLFAVRTGGPDYTLAATPLGPPDPDGEREPNSDAAHAERYRVGTRRIGRLPDPSDLDVVRLTVAAPQHIRFAINPPPDASVGMRLSLGGEEVSEITGFAPGTPITHDVWLQPGDHLIELFSTEGSEARYELRSERLDPFALRADQEPNDDPAWASPLPPSLAWDGDAADADDADWYAIPPLVEAGPIRIDLQGEDVRAEIGLLDEGNDFVRYLVPERQVDGSLVVADAPVGVPLLLAIRSAGRYDIALEVPGLTAHAAPERPPVELTWQLAAAGVASYWPEQQLIDGTLTIANSGAAPVDLRLETSTSHYLWQATLDESEVTVPASGSVEVPVRVTAGPDAWAQETVLLGARAVADDGGQASATVELRATAEAQPLSPTLGWPLPSELLGGANVASLGLGAVPAGTIDPDVEPALYDGVTPDGGGFRVYLGDVGGRLPIDLVVDLAGDVPVSVVGTILNTQAGAGALADMARDVELLLSEDGIEWRSVLRTRLSALPVDQPFVLPEPLPATHALLRIHDKQTADRGGYLELGEWKVIGAPGTPVGDDPLDLAEPARGGHLISSVPFSDDEALGARVLDEDLTRDAITLSDVRDVLMVVGLQDGRAALLTGLEWSDPTGSRTTERLERVDVATSMRSPLGPWQPLGTWDLARGADGAVAPFALVEPTWARYVRLSGQAPIDVPSVELPGALRILETATSDAYRSILGEWGYRSPMGPYEWLGSQDAIAWVFDADAGDAVEDATPLVADMVAFDRAEIDLDEDWYRLTIPAGDNTLEVVVDGRPTVGVRLSLVDLATGAERPMAFEIAADGSVHFEARVDPAASYALRVRQPPFSAVFAIDTSSSIDPFLDLVTQGLRSFLADVRPGREVVSIVPFDEQPLLPEWEADPYVLQGAFDAHIVPAPGSSSVETGLVDSADLLSEREGARAILLVTDAETSSYDATPDLWQRLSSVRPIIFAVHIGAIGQPVETRQRMQDWAASGGGVYAYPSTAGEMDRAFERMATWLRRPAAYALTYSTSSVVLDPGLLTVNAPADGTRPPIAPGVGVELILDTSGSMLERLEGRTRIDIAKAALESVVRDGLDDGVPVALRTFGGKGKGRKARCETQLTQPLEPLDKTAMTSRIRKLIARKATSTPIGAALLAVADDLAGVTGPRTVVLVTDGEETCKGDPVAAIEALRANGLDVHVNIVGFALEDEAVKASMAEWAADGGGSYFDAVGVESLAGAISSAVAAPFVVYGPDDTVLASGTVGGGPTRLDPGTYRVEVLVDPPITFGEVVVGGGQVVDLVLPAADDEG